MRFSYMLCIWVSIPHTIYICVYPYIIYHDDQSTMLPYTIYQYIISRIPYIYPLYHIRYSISRFMVWMHLCIHISYLPSTMAFSRMTHQQCCHISYPIYLLYPLYTNTVTLTTLAVMLKPYLPYLSTVR